ncbi:MAG: heme-binding protein [Betaproteobacteria bacterium]|nr:heme-binding protein [Betaproteobacteria bacterium]MDE2124828.1 heme-binding protein [Betaproteobacteria bacterium]MDE2187583.1 heme-binding protein [Betaproteobacteria bacterium]MDE2325872.1 heme-binding protein [Betaproteobacteria bacterium]
MPSLRNTPLSALALILCGASLALTAHAAEPLAISVKRLQLETALKAAQAAMTSCRAKGIQIGVTVVDRSGQPQVMLRDVLAPDLTVRVSELKAYTAVSFNAPTSALKAQAQSSLAHVPGLLFSAGAVPITAGGTLYGAIGVSGAPAGETDEACAKAGAAAIEPDLEMQ